MISTQLGGCACGNMRSKQAIFDAQAVDCYQLDISITTVDGDRSLGATDG